MMLSFPHTNIERKSSSEETLSTSMVSEINEEKENIPLCNYCRKSFANYSNLRHHIQIVHLKESKWDCSKCGKVNPIDKIHRRSFLYHSDLLIEIESKSSFSYAYSCQTLHM